MVSNCIQTELYHETNLSQAGSSLSCKPVPASSLITETNYFAKLLTVQARMQPTGVLRTLRENSRICNRLQIMDGQSICKGVEACVNSILFCRLIDAIQLCCASQSLQTLHLRLLTKLHAGVRYIVDLPQSLKSLKLIVWAAPQIDALLQLSSLKDLDLEFGEQFGDMRMAQEERTRSIYLTIRKVLATLMSTP